MTTKRSFFVIIFAALCVLSGCGGRKQQEEERSERISGAEHAGVQNEKEAYR
jgi:hypothetical protein